MSRSTGTTKAPRKCPGTISISSSLDETHYALIKCDVSGHGVSAGLIMVEVATLFINHFRDWKQRKDSLAQIKDPGERQRLLKDLERLDTLVYTINDMLEERGFKGLFAAFTICLFNTATGAITVCPAGDNEVNIYDVSEKRMVHRELTSKEKGSPAAGVFPSMLVEMKSGFPQFPSISITGTCCSSLRTVSMRQRDSWETPHSK